MEREPKRVEVRFYRTDSGNEPVRVWLKSLPVEDRRIVGFDLQTLEYGWPIGMPLCRAISGQRGLWELRSNLTGGRIARILFTVADGRLIALHGFIKKTQRTPDRDIQTAVRRMKAG